jgi:hypothetical protein
VANGVAHRDVVIDHEDSRRRGSGMVGDPTGLFSSRRDIPFGKYWGRGFQHPRTVFSLSVTERCESVSTFA